MLALTLSILLSQAPTAAPSKLELAKQGWELSSKNFNAGMGTVDQAVAWGARLYDAEKGSDSTAAQRHLERLRDLEKRAQERFNQGMGTKLDVLTVSYLRAQAEEQLPKK